MYTFGQGEYGQVVLGHGDAGNRFSPVFVHTLVGHAITMVESDYIHNTSLTPTGQYVFTRGLRGSKLGHDGPP